MDYALYYEQGNSHVNGLVQERRNSIAHALELRFSCTNPSMSKHDRSFGSI